MVTTGLAGRSAREWLSSMPACFLLLAVVIFSTSSDIHNKMLKMGQQFWDGYYNLRTDPVPPHCDPNVDIETQLQARLAQERARQQGDDLIADLFVDEPLSPETLRQSLVNARNACLAQFERYEELKEQVTPGLRVYRAVELFVADIIAYGLTSQRFVLALLITICAATATLARHHIALRAMQTVLDHRVSSLAQFVANSMLLVSIWAFRDLTHATSEVVEASREALHWMWIICFGLLAVLSGLQVFRVPAHAKPGGNLGQALLAIPLYSTMCLIAGSFFMFAGHLAGIGIYLDKLMDFSDTFLNVALYVWAGMMLKQTRLASLVFNLFRPWKLAPEVLAFLVVMIAAVPTAYTGASGIFVIAAGAVIYAELRAVGARRQLALAATAMSGSLGVVLRPCLLVVVIAMLNRQVTTDQLFDWGIYVFILTSFLFLAAVLLINRRNPLTMAPVAQALPLSLREAGALVPYVLVIGATVLVYSEFLDVALNEFSAPRILPVMLLALLVYEHFSSRKAGRLDVADNAVGVMPLVSMQGQTGGNGEQPKRHIERSLRGATNDTTAEIGALLLLFGLSVSIGGVIERSGMMEAFPQSFGSPWMAMLLLMIVLVVLGMVMDAFGAIILVSATIATIAYDSGIHPVHFWMVVLVAFELGYLSPPVALNHLLTRQVVGEEEMRLASEEPGTFYQRHERILMPLIVMSIALVLVAFVPLAVGYR